MKIADLTIPGITGPIDSGLPTGTPTGGITTGQNAIQAFLNLTLVIAILLSLYFIIKGGFDIITSQGDKEKMKNGRGRVIFALLGLIFIFTSFLIIRILGTVVNVDFLCIIFRNPASDCL
jgi:hypothetical protein